MPYTLEKPPDWLKNLPAGAIKIGVAALNSDFEKTGNEESARKAAWGAIKQKYEKGDDDTWRAKQDVSLDDIRDMIWKALDERQKDAYLQDVYGAYMVYEADRKYYKLAYSILDGEVQFGSDPMEVKKEWVIANTKPLEMPVRLVQATDPEGASWEIVICEPGLTKNGWYHPEEVLRASADLFEGVSLNFYDLPKKGATHIQDSLFDLKKFLVANKAGWIEKVRYVAGEGLKGTLHFLDSFKWLGKNLLAAMAEGARVYGLSYDAPAQAKKSTIDGRSVLELVKLYGVDSVDIVDRPAAGGKFIRAVAAQKEGDIMNKQELWNMIEKARPELLKGKTLEAISDEELTGLVRMAMEPGADQSAGDGNQPAVDSQQSANQGGDGDPGVTREDFDKLRCDMALKDKLAGSDLDEAGRKHIWERFHGRVFEEAELDKELGALKDLLATKAQMDQGAGAGDVDGIPASGRICVGIGTLERAQMAVDRMFGLTKEDMEGFARMERLDHKPFFEDVRSAQDYQEMDKVPPFSSLHEMYVFFTGDPEVRGVFNQKGLKARMDITSSTFTYAFGNTLGRRLVKDYLAANFREDLIISVAKSVKDFRQQEAVKVGFFGDLDTVDPETADYQEIAAVTDEEATYTLAQKGNLLTITRKTIINDDLSLVQRLVSRLGRAARRTHAQYVWDMWVDNDNCSDGTAWHTSGHGNLGAAALSITTALAAWKALAKMTEKDSAKRIGLLDDPGLKVSLIHPPDLFDTADIVANNEYYPGSTTNLNDRNPMRNKLVPVQVSLLTDTNDWGIIAPNALVDHVEMGYLNGRREPEMFVADSPQSEQVFVADKIRYKIRHEYAGTPVDYVGSYKAQVA